MPNIAQALKQEISRLSRREIRVSLEKSQKSLSNHRHDLSSLKDQVRTLERQVSALEKAVARPSSAAPVDAVTAKARFVPRGLVSMRKRLDLSVAELAKLMGVSAQTIYNWERGATRPGAGQQARLASLRGVGKRQMKAVLAAQKTLEVGDDR